MTAVLTIPSMNGKLISPLFTIILNINSLKVSKVGLDLFNCPTGLLEESNIQNKILVSLQNKDNFYSSTAKLMIPLEKMVRNKILLYLNWIKMVDDNGVQQFLLVFFGTVLEERRHANTDCISRIANIF